MSVTFHLQRGLGRVLNTLADRVEKVCCQFRPPTRREKAGRA